MAKHFIAKTGLDWLDPNTGKPVRVEAGERCDDVPEASQGWLSKQGLIVAVDAKGKPIEKDD